MQLADPPVCAACKKKASLREQIPSTCRRRSAACDAKRSALWYINALARLLKQDMRHLH
jgi:hypothetical protein